MKYALGAIWLAAAYGVAGMPGGRRVFAYLGPIVALAHVGALVGGLLSQQLKRQSVEGGVSLAGFLIGLALGILLGVALGGPADRNPVIYWVAQIAAAGFIMFLPLFRV